MWDREYRYAGALAEGTTTIINSAKEPELCICEILKEAGVKIDGIGTSIITIKGTAGEPIEFKDIEIIPDRIEAGTYLCAGAITNSSITIKRANHRDISSSIDKLEAMGCRFHISGDEINIEPTVD